MTIFDTSGIEAWVTENNPKYANRIIKQLKAFAKANNLDKSYDPYKAAYGSMPTHAASNQAIISSKCCLNKLNANEYGNGDSQRTLLILFFSLCQSYLNQLNLILLSIKLQHENQNMLYSQ